MIRIRRKFVSYQIYKIQNRNFKIETTNVVRLGRTGLIVTVLDPATDELLGQWTKMNDKDRAENLCMYDPAVKQVIKHLNNK
jgi:hypothetical protein